VRVGELLVQRVDLLPCGEQLGLFLLALLVGGLKPLLQLGQLLVMRAAGFLAGADDRGRSWEVHCHCLGVMC
jgi:hypothetical protein